MRQQRLGATWPCIIYIMYIHTRNMYIICAVVCAIYSVITRSRCDNILHVLCVLSMRKKLLITTVGQRRTDASCGVDAWRRECDSLIMTMGMTMNDIAVTREFPSLSAVRSKTSWPSWLRANGRDRDCNRDRPISEHPGQQNTHSHHWIAYKQEHPKKQLNEEGASVPHLYYFAIISPRVQSDIKHLHSEYFWISIGYPGILTKLSFFFKLKKHVIYLHSSVHSLLRPRNHTVGYHITRIKTSNKSQLVERMLYTCRIFLA